MTALAVAARLIQFLAAVILCGSPLLFLYGLRGPERLQAVRLAWPRRGLVLAGVVLLLGALVSLCLETSTMTGDAGAAIDPDAIWTVLTSSQFGLAVAIRMGLAALAIVVGAGQPAVGRLAWSAIVGAAVLASFAWTGHGAMDEGISGLVHLSADIVHLWSAGVWLGALAALMALAASRDEAVVAALHQGLKRFSGVGSVVVALLLLTGLVNSWFLIGVDHLGAAVRSRYGLLLIAKLALFALMLGLAGLNRYVLTPRLAGARPGLSALRLSVGLESLAGLGVLGLVAALGTLAPPAMA